MKTERNILVAFLLNITFSIFEFVGGIFTNSVSIMSDSIHDFTDALSIGISYFLERKSKVKPNDKYTYGYKRFSLLGGIITTTILTVGSLFVIYSSILRIMNPVKVNYDGMLILAIIGVIINFLAAYFTREVDSINQRAVNLHMLEDVLGWVVVLIGSIIMKFMDISIIDPIMSLLVAGFILHNAIGNLKSVLYIFLEKVPDNVSLDKIQKELMKIKGVKDVHHIHVRSIDGISNYATMHVVVEDYKIKERIKHCLEQQNINHSTIELEMVDEDCHTHECNIDVDLHISSHHHHH